MGAYLNLFGNAFSAVSSWFASILDQSGVGPIYLACVFISLAIGFLLSSFRNGFSSGASDSAAEAYRNSGNGKFSPKNRASRYGSGSNGGRYERK